MGADDILARLEANSKEAEELAHRLAMLPNIPPPARRIAALLHDAAHYIEQAADSHEEAA